MNLGKVKTFLIILFLGINIYLACVTYYSSRFFTDAKTLDTAVDILKNYDITVKAETVPKYTVNLLNIDTENIIYSKKFNKSGNFSTNGDEFTSTVKEKNIHLAKESAVKRSVLDYLSENGFETRNMKFKNDGDKLIIYCNIRGYDIFDSLITVDVKENSYTLSGSWFEPLTNKVHSRSRERKTVYITSILLSMAQNEDITKNTPFEITKIDYGYLAGKSYDGSHVTAAALPYYRIYDSKGNIYYYDAVNGTKLGG